MSTLLSCREDREKLIKRLIYIILFAAVLRIDMITGTDGGWLRMTYANLWGVIVCVIVLMQDSFIAYKKLPYYIWLGVCVVGLPIAIIVITRTVFYQGQWITGAINVATFGFVIIKLIYDYIVNKKPIEINKPVFALWLLMMALMIVSRNDSFWPFWFLIMFGSLYLTKFDQENVALLVGGASEGIIAGFFYIQCFAFLYRPFDEVRYLGAYANSNVNALMYTIAYAAFLYKWYALIRMPGCKRIWRIAPAFLAAMMNSFVLLTQCRSATLAMFVETIGFLIVVTAMEKEKRARAFANRAVLIFLLSIVSFVPVYLGARFIPALRHHPIWYDYEYSEDKVHSYDPIMSDKYVSPTEIFETSFSRYIHGSEGTWAEKDAMLELEQYEERAMASANDPTLNFNPEDEPFESTVYRYSSTSRLEVYKYFLRHLNFAGHRECESTVTTSNGFYAPHAHDVYLQWAFSFGILPGLLFVGMLLYNLYKTFWYIGQRNYSTALILGLLTVSFGVFGAFEITWRIGQASLFLYFLVFKLSLSKVLESDFTVFDKTNNL